MKLIVDRTRILPFALAASRWHVLHRYTIVDLYLLYDAHSPTLGDFAFMIRLQ